MPFGLSKGSVKAMTILVDHERCNRCGVCSDVCTAAIINTRTEGVPSIDDASADACIECGHCEAFCPSQALILNLRPHERVAIPRGAGSVAASALDLYVQKRRSVRKFTSTPVPQEA